MLSIGVLQPEQIPAVRELLSDYFAWALSLEEGAQDAPTFKNIQHELDTLPGEYAPPRGRFLVAEMEGKVVGSVAFREMDSETAELKRLFVRPEARGHALGQKLVAELIRQAKEAGYRRMYLDSHHTMKSAHAVYRAEGFNDIPAPAEFPVEYIPVVVFMEREL